MSLLHSVLRIMFRRRRFILAVSLLFALVAGIVTLAMPRQYRADAQVLIISKSQYGIDPLTTVKSAEQIGENLIQVMWTSDFLDKVKQQSAQTFDWQAFNNLSERDRRKKWKQDVQSSLVKDTSLLNVTTYHQDAGQARVLAEAVAATLESNGWQYVGGDVTISLVNKPLLSKWKVRPHIGVNIFLGFIVGMGLAGIAVIRKK